MRNCEPIFIVGMNGSGTTMLLNCLNNHPVLYGFPLETKLLPYYMAILPKYGKLNNDDNFRKLFDDLRNENIFKIINKGIAPPLPKNWRRLARGLAPVIDCIYSYFAVKENKYRWCDKTPMHALYISAISELFPEAKFIHIIRDGRGCAASFQRRWKYKPELTIYRWKKLVRETRRQGVMLGDKYHEVHYEKLTENPEKWMRNISSFLKIPFSDSTLRVSRIRPWSGSEAPAITNNPIKWRSYWSEKQICRLEKIAGQELFNLNYPTIFPESDSEPRRILLAYWLYFGYAKEKIPKIISSIINNKKRKKNWAIYKAELMRFIKNRLAGIIE